MEPAGMALTAEELTELRFTLEHPPPRRRRERDVWWHKVALCAELGPGLHYAEDEEPAKALCRPCAARVECLAHALEFGEEFGVWGGLGPLELEELRAELLPRPAAELEAKPGRLYPLRLAREERTLDEEVAALEDYRRAASDMEHARAELEASIEARRDALARLYRQGLTVAELGRMTGLSRVRVTQLLELRAG